MSILVYTKRFSPRIKYVFHLLLVDVLGLETAVFTTDKASFEQHEEPRINYSLDKFEGTIQIVPAGLLNEKDIAEQEITVTTHQNTPIFFQTAGGDLPFDVFAAAFYLAARYEEYLPFISDAHNRFPPTESLAYKNNFLHIPVVNIWAGWLKALLQNRYNGLVFNAQPYKLLCTVDVDNLYAYRGKGFYRTFGALAKDALSFDFKTAFNRAKTVWGSKTDPFDTFDDQIEMQRQLGISSLYFMLFSEFSKFDRNVSMHNPMMHNQVRHMQDYTTVGIHPSYQSNTHTGILAQEIQQLEAVLHAPVTHSRQHFLKLRLPETLRNLADLGIQHDYTMGYAAQSGFRAGLATPFHFYDLDMEEELNLTLHPFMVMDVTYIDYNKVDAATALAEMQKFVDATKAVGGTFIPVFHNRVFSQMQPEWQGWRQVVRDLLSYARP